MSMNVAFKFLASAWLSALLVVAIVASVLADREVGKRIANEERKAELRGEVYDQVTGIANAIEQYCIDFPDAGPIANNHEWTERLAGRNAKNIRYLKVEKFSRDTVDRLLDPCGGPYVIEVQGNPGFQSISPEEAANEFHVRPSGCQGEWVAIGNRKHPRFPRSY
jgi:hypothetical protein